MTPESEADLQQRRSIRESICGALSHSPADWVDRWHTARAASIDTRLRMLVARSALTAARRASRRGLSFLRIKDELAARERLMQRANEPADAAFQRAGSGTRRLATLFACAAAVMLGSQHMEAHNVYENGARYPTKIDLPGHVIAGGTLDNSDALAPLVWPRAPAVHWIVFAVDIDELSEEVRTSLAERGLMRPAMFYAFPAGRAVDAAALAPGAAVRIHQSTAGEADEQRSWLARVLAPRAEWRGNTAGLRPVDTTLSWQCLSAIAIGVLATAATFVVRTPMRPLPLRFQNSGSLFLSLAGPAWAGAVAFVQPPAFGEAVDRALQALAAEHGA